MAGDAEDAAPWLDEETVPTLVEGSGGLRPFMAGILVHWLVLRDVPFAKAYAVAREVERRLEGRTRASTREISDAVHGLLGWGRAPSGHPVPSPADIMITGTGDGLPFSKGILSQSLLATAMDPAAAFSVAREIEHELMESAVREMGRRDLRALACRVLRRRTDAETAERYLLWRRYQEPERPVILLLGGTSGVGKTSLALEVARRLGIGRVLSTDSIRQMMRILLSQELVPAIYGSSYDAYKLLPREDGRPPSVIDGFRAQAAAVSVGIRASLDRTVEESSNLAVDGVSIAPGSIDVEAYADRAHVIFLIIAALDENALRNRFVARASGQKRRLPHRYLENLEGILEIQRYLLALAKRHGVPVVDNLSFDASVRLIIGHVMDALRRSEASDASHAGPPRER